MPTPVDDTLFAKSISYTDYQPESSSSTVEFLLNRKLYNLLSKTASSGSWVLVAPLSFPYKDHLADLFYYIAQAGENIRLGLYFAEHEKSVFLYSKLNSHENAVMLHIPAEYMPGSGSDDKIMEELYVLLSNQQATKTSNNKA